MKTLTLSIPLILLSSCSIFQPAQQELTITGTGKAIINDVSVNLPTVVKVDRDKPVTVNKFNNTGALIFTKTVTPVP